MLDRLLDSVGLGFIVQLHRLFVFPCLASVTRPPGRTTEARFSLHCEKYEPSFLSNYRIFIQMCSESKNNFLFIFCVNANENGMAFWAVLSDTLRFLAH